MSKMVSRYLEIERLIDSGSPVAFCCHPVARVTVQQLDPGSTLSVFIQVSPMGLCIQGLAPVSSMRISTEST